MGIGAIADAACATEFVESVAICDKAIEVITQNMTPTSIDDLTDINLWKRVEGSATMDEGLRITALQLAEAIKANNFSQINNIFDDLQNNFRKSGLSKDAALNATWDILGLISNHGPDTGTAIAHLETNDFDIKTKKAAAIQYIAAAMTYIDYKRLKQSLPMYSYPPNIRSSCDNSKPYHFWLSAYLARALVREDKMSPWVAAKSTYLAEKGYQINRNKAQGQRSTVSRLFNEKLYSPSHEIVRSDLAYSSAGALYGAQSAQAPSSTKYNVNTGLVTLEQNAGDVTFSPGEASSLNQIDAFMKWSEIFQPDSVFNEMAKGFKH